ncbi:GntR family transcriptional regulator [Curtobacterium sp. MCPF17_052]|uniref:GntR family transcriptional regulator n=1 Tax=Curtobacterium sp. MCPF17_052 TaxID=2175655 RepID=UPI001C651103|nr:GntR family transcriptional regulator [Curtobacterium sp. MCPF17_052]WIB12264.1 GntR family transcriptional regulator [Curtobacterium sp. MCPF17_052]
MDEDALDFPMLQSSTLGQRVFDELRARILDGRLPAGADVADSVIARELHVSRAPVRDACNQLVADGLMTKQQNYPFRVREWTEDNLVELNLIRWSYETAAARFLTETERPVLPEVAEALGRMDAAAAAGDPAASMQADMQFHFAFVESTELPELIALHRRVGERALLVPIPADLPMNVLSLQRQRHEQILHALAESRKAGDVVAVSTALKHHMLTYRTLAGLAAQSGS